jgi:hypothetical protein
VWAGDRLSPACSSCPSPRASRAASGAAVKDCYLTYTAFMLTAAIDAGGTLSIGEAKGVLLGRGPLFERLESPPFDLDFSILSPAYRAEILAGWRELADVLDGRERRFVLLHFGFFVRSVLLTWRRPAVLLLSGGKSVSRSLAAPRSPGGPMPGIPSFPSVASDTAIW